jgi:tripartite-type tricarboxylate transporter receptor subunit TctC
MARRKLPLMLAAAAALLSGWAMPAGAQQNYPDKQIHVLLGFLPGTSSDILCRFYTNKLQELTKQTVILENKPGALGLLAGGVVSRARPDGYTIWFTANIPSARFLLKEVPFNPDTDFTAVGPLFSTPFMLSVSAKSDIKSVSDLVARLKKQPLGRYGYGSPTTLIATAYFLNQTGAQAEGVGYRGASQALPEVENQTLDFIINDAMTAWPLSQAGRLRGLAVASGERVSSIPLPTMQEAGVPDYNFDGWWGAFVPSQTPAAVVAKLASLFAQINRDPATKTFLDSVVAAPMAGDANWMKKQMAEDQETWAKLVKLTGLQPQ